MPRRTSRPAELPADRAASATRATCGDQAPPRIPALRDSEERWDAEEFKLFKQHSVGMAASREAFRPLFRREAVPRGGNTEAKTFFARRAVSDWSSQRERAARAQ